MSRAVLLEPRPKGILYRRVSMVYRDSKQTTTVRHGAILLCSPVFWSILKANYEQWPIIRKEDILYVNPPHCMAIHLAKECPAPYSDMLYINVRRYECADYEPAPAPRRNVQLVAK